MRKMTWDEVKEIHEDTGLTGYYKLYPDNSEAVIDSGYTWEEIEDHHNRGGEFGEELDRVDLVLADGKRVTAPSVVDISSLDNFDELEYEMWHTIENYLTMFGICTEDDEPDWATVKAVQDKLLEVLEEAGVRFKVLTDEQQEAVDEALKEKGKDTIREQCEQLQCQTDYIRATVPELKGAAKIIERGIDLIKELAAINDGFRAERYARKRNGGWIPCNERLPQPFLVRDIFHRPQNYMTCPVLVTVKSDECDGVHYYVSSDYMSGHTPEDMDWVMSCGYGGTAVYSQKIIAWQPKPEEYKEGK